MVDRLEADGFVMRASHPSERRGRLAVLTRAGRAACANAIQRKSERDVQRESPEEVRQLRVLLAKLQGVSQ